MLWHMSVSTHSSLVVKQRRNLAEMFADFWFRIRPEDGAGVKCWFACWLPANFPLPPPEIVYNLWCNAWILRCLNIHCLSLRMSIRVKRTDQKREFVLFYVAGMISSAFISGFVADTFGRKRCLMISFSLDAFFVILCGFSQNFQMLIMSKFMTGFV